MPTSVHTLIDGDSACVNVLACMCKEVQGGQPCCIVVRERTRVHLSPLSSRG